LKSQPDYLKKKKKKKEKKKRSEEHCCTRTGKNPNSLLTVKIAT